MIIPMKKITTATSAIVAPAAVSLVVADQHPEQARHGAESVASTMTTGTRAANSVAVRGRRDEEREHQQVAHRGERRDDRDRQEDEQADVGQAGPQPEQGGLPSRRTC